MDKETILLVRKNNRLDQDLYEGEYWYFVTICSHEKAEIFSKFVWECLPFPQENTCIFQPSYIGKSIEKTWLSLPDKFENLIQNSFVLMPNHIHFIVGFDGTLYYKNQPQNLMQFVSKFKSLCWYEINKHHKTHGNGKHSPTKTSTSQEGNKHTGDEPCQVPNGTWGVARTNTKTQNTCRRGADSTKYTNVSTQRSNVPF
jgi:REP element-mobilizing transposase RayT